MTRPKNIINLLIRYSGLLFLPIVLGCLTFVRSQDLSADLSAVNSIGTTSEKFHAKIKVSVFQYEGSKTPLVVKSCEIKKNGNEFYYVIDQSRILINENCTLLINDESKSVVFTKSTEKIEFDESLLINIDSLVSQYDSISFEGSKKGIKKYTIYKAKSAIPVMDVYLNLSGKSIDKLVYHYDKKIYPSNHLIEIVYEKWTSSPTFSESEFSESKYIRKIKKTYALVGDLASYELIINEPEQ